MNIYTISESDIIPEALESFICFMNNNLTENMELIVLDESKTRFDGNIRVEPRVNIENYYGGYSANLTKVIAGDHDIEKFLTNQAKLSLTNQFLNQFDL